VFPIRTSSDLARQILSSWLDRALSLLREELLCSAPVSGNGSMFCISCPP